MLKVNVTTLAVIPRIRRWNVDPRVPIPNHLVPVPADLLRSKKEPNPNFNPFLHFFVLLFSSAFIILLETIENFVLSFLCLSLFFFHSMNLLFFQS